METIFKRFIDEVMIPKLNNTHDIILSYIEELEERLEYEPDVIIDIENYESDADNVMSDMLLLEMIKFNENETETLNEIIKRHNEMFDDEGYYR